MTGYDFLSGAVAFGLFVCGLFFLRLWRRTHDALLMSFAVAFALLGVGQSLASLANIPTEERAPIYLFRLVAFAVIILAIARKNRTSRS
ncbi:MAG: DUF5985 family protein [Sphingomicrobium sp.]